MLLTWLGGKEEGTGFHCKTSPVKSRYESEILSFNEVRSLITQNPPKVPFPLHHCCSAKQVSNTWAVAGQRRTKPSQLRRLDAWKCSRISFSKGMWKEIQAGPLVLSDSCLVRILIFFFFASKLAVGLMEAVSTVLASVFLASLCQCPYLSILRVKLLASSWESELHVNCRTLYVSGTVF